MYETHTPCTQCGIDDSLAFGARADRLCLDCDGDRIAAGGKDAVFEREMRRFRDYDDGIIAEDDH
jgi:hypothetical protein